MQKVPLKKIKSYFDKIVFTDDVIQLDKCTTITNLDKFYKSHISIFEEKNKVNKSILMPYYMRLLKLYYLYTDGKVQ
jgi:hypothetical protein